MSCTQPSAILLHDWQRSRLFLYQCHHKHMSHVFCCDIMMAGMSTVGILQFHYNLMGPPPLTTTSLCWTWLYLINIGWLITLLALLCQENFSFSPLTGEHETCLFFPSLSRCWRYPEPWDGLNPLEAKGSEVQLETSAGLGWQHYLKGHKSVAKIPLSWLTGPRRM